MDSKGILKNNESGTKFNMSFVRPANLYHFLHRLIHLMPTKAL